MVGCPAGKLLKGKKMQKILKEFGLNTDNSVYVIAEIGLNHGGDIDVAKKLIDSAAKTGVDAVKFQTYITEKRVPKDSPIFGILKQCELPFDAFKELKNYSENYGIEFFSTPFDEESVDYLENIDCNIYKIASFDVVNNTLLKKIASTKKAVIMSVGMSNIDEINHAYDILKTATKKISLLHCISAYPTSEMDANLAAIFSLKQNYDCVIGQSDHTNDIIVPLYAVAAGAQVVEKHFKIDDAMNCVDAPVSITELQLKKLVSEIRRIESIFGNGQLGITNAQKGTVVFRRYKQ
jgi:sialic acid synthase SpsE